jgi:heme-degrading monooxygenase HmoA
MTTDKQHRNAYLYYDGRQSQMYIRVATAQIKSGMVDELAEKMTRYFEEAIAQARQVPGFLGHQFMVNRETSKIAIISHWDTEEAAKQQGNALQQMASLAATYFAGKPNIEGFELRFEV